MKNRILKYGFLIAIFFGCSQLRSQSDDLKVQEYPEGIYATFEDFKMIAPKGSKGDFTIKTGNDTISHRFFSSATEKRMKKEFAFSDGEDIYVNVVGILKNLPREDMGQMVDGGNYHLKAKNIGERYVYFEDYFTSQNAQMLGGLIAAAASRRIKGVVYDMENKSFNLFKNAEDFEQFIEKNHPEYMQKLRAKEDPEKRKKKIENIALIREIIFEINTGQAGV